MKKFLGGLAISALLAAPALAADLPARMPVKAPAPVVVAVYNWTGFYVGANVGYAWSVDDHLLSFTNVGTFAGVNPKGAFGGGQIGYNWQAGGPLVLGIEADIQGGRIHDSGISSAARGTDYNLRWFGTVRGRVGFAVDRSLLYATGGFAYGGLNKHTFAGIPTDFTFSDTATGYAVGGGGEFAFVSNWSVKVEYQYINLRRNDMFDPAGVNYATTRDLNNAADAFHTVRVGINYRFGGPVVARY
jgi:outer membrane immunogenic protein